MDMDLSSRWDGMGLTDLLNWDWPFCQVLLVFSLLVSVGGLGEADMICCLESGFPDWSCFLSDVRGKSIDVNLWEATRRSRGSEARVRVAG